MFTTLEPCTGRNPPKIPGVERIIARRIRRVVIGVLDPNPLICGRGERRLRKAGIEVELFPRELMEQVEELNRDFDRLHEEPHAPDRTSAQTADPASDEVGPNGHRIGYTEEGDKVESVPGDDESGELWPLLLRRNDKLILATYNELWDKVWWNRHQNWRHRIETGQEELTPEREALFVRAAKAAAAIEEQYGREHLVWVLEHRSPAIQVNRWPPAAGPEVELQVDVDTEEAVRSVLAAVGISVLAIRTRP